MHVCWMWRRNLSKNCWIVQRICVILLLMWDDDGMRRLSTRRERNEMMVMMMILLWLMIHETRDDWWLMIIHETIGRVSPGRRYLAILSRYLLEDRRDGPSGPAILVKYRTISRAARDTWNFLKETMLLVNDIFDLPMINETTHSIKENWRIIDNGKGWCR